MLLFYQPSHAYPITMDGTLQQRKHLTAAEKSRLNLWRGAAIHTCRSCRACSVVNGVHIYRCPCIAMGGFRARKLPTPNPPATIDGSIAFRRRTENRETRDTKVMHNGRVVAHVRWLHRPGIRQGVAHAETLAAVYSAVLASCEATNLQNDTRCSDLAKLKGAGFGLKYLFAQKRVGWWGWTHKHPREAWEILQVFKYMWRTFVSMYPEEAHEQMKFSDQLEAYGLKRMPDTGWTCGFVNVGVAPMHRDKFERGLAVLLVLNLDEKASALVVQVGEHKVALDTSGEATLVVLDAATYNHGSVVQPTKTKVGGSGGLRFAITAYNEERVLAAAKKDSVDVYLGDPPSSCTEQVEQ